MTIATTASELSEPCTPLVRALEDDIVLGRLHPRERLVEDDLMVRFAAKRHLVRDALVRLEQLGLVERRRNIGAMVRSFEQREVLELYELRELLETAAAARIPLPAAEADLQALTEIQQRHDDAVQAGDPAAVYRANEAFHRALFSLAGNDAMTQAIREYARRTHAIRFGTLIAASYRERARREHWQIIEALREGRREDLVALCRGHLLPSRDVYLQAHGGSAVA